LSSVQELPEHGRRNGQATGCSQPDTSFLVSVDCLAENQIKLITGN